MSNYYKVTINNTEYVMEYDMLRLVTCSIVIEQIEKDSCRIILPFGECYVDWGVSYILRLIENRMYGVFIETIVNAGIPLNEVFKYLTNELKSKE